MKRKDTRAPGDTVAGWAKTGPYEYVHSGEWTITNRFVGGKPRWVLCHGKHQVGTFAMAEEAMKYHAGLDHDDNS